MALVASQIGFDASKIVSSDDLLEQCHGGWEGRLRTEVYTPEVNAALDKDIWRFRPDGLSADGLASESQKDVEERIRGYIEAHILAAKDGLDPKKMTTVAVFGHGLSQKFFLRGVLSFAPDNSRKLSIDNVAITELKYEIKDGNRGGWSVIRINDTGHIRPQK